MTGERPDRRRSRKPRLPLSKVSNVGAASAALLTHKRPLPFDLPEGSNVEMVHGDLEARVSLAESCAHIDCLVYLAGVLFQPRPQTFLHRTNTVYVENIVDAALSAGVRKFILVSFPHVEEHTTPQAPARGSLDVSHVDPCAHSAGSREISVSRVPRSRHGTHRAQGRRDLRTRRKAYRRGALADEEAPDGHLAQTDLDPLAQLAGFSQMRRGQY